MHTTLTDLDAATSFVGAEIAAKAASRMVARLADQANKVTVGEVRDCIADVQSRLRDEFDLVQMIVLNRGQKSLCEPANKLVDGWDITGIFPEAARELEEGCKCVALQRPTAAVFHAMRMMEVGMRKFSELLNLPDPATVNDRNWGNMLKAIKDEIDRKYPPKERLPGTDGVPLEQLYVSLDAVKNAWRNPTMHVTTFYQDGEAIHILRCCAYFMETLAHHFRPDQVDAPEGKGAFG